MLWVTIPTLSDSMEQQIAIPLKRYACPDFTQTELDVYTRASSNIGAQSGVFPV